MFCDLENQGLDLVPLETTMCLEICRVSDPRYACLLDKTRVHKLDFQDKSICGCENYKSDLNHLIQMLDDSCFAASDEDGESKRQLPGRCISDDGRTVLFGLGHEK